jgi:hypothetical protein
MKQAVEDEDLDLGREGMALFDGLLERRGNRDGKVAGDLFCADAAGGEGKHVGGFVFAAKVAIEFADSRIGGEQGGNFAFEADCGLGLGEKRARVRAEGRR